MYSTPEFEAKHQRDWQILEPVIQLLKIGYMTSFALLAIGVIVSLVRDIDISSRLGTPGKLVDQIAHGNPNGFLGAGIGVMILTPILMTLFIAWLFFKNGEHRYSLISLGVFAILVASFSFAL